jgi:hypothetical protein
MASIKLKGDTSGELTIQAPSVAGTNTLDLPASSGTLLTTTGNGSQLTGLPNSYAGTKNRIINGNMAIDQRNAGASVTPANGAYLLDRYSVIRSQASKYSVQHVTDAPVGFTNSMLITSLSAYSVVASDIFHVMQKIEGYNVYDLAWGTASAQSVTVSFWAKSSLTGTFGGSLVNSAEDRSYPFTYTISSANTWEYKTVTVAGDTTGTWLTNNGIGIRCHFTIGMGSNYTATAGAWTAGAKFAPTGATSVVGTSGATLYITGVQLETGTTATDFENLQYGQQLALCQRYYYATSSAFIAATATTLCYNLQFPVTMRSTPTETHTYAGVVNDVYNIITAATPTFVPNGNFPINTGMKFAYDFDAGLTAGQPYQTDFTFSAEL